MTATQRSTRSSQPDTVVEKEDEFATFSIASDTNLCNPATKSGKALFDQLSKSNIKPENRIKGMSSEGESFRSLMKELAARSDFKGILTFTDSSGKKHDLANAPEFTSIEQIIEHNNKNVWSFNETTVSKGKIVPFKDQPRSSEDEKNALRKAIDKRAKNQTNIGQLQKDTLSGCTGITAKATCSSLTTF